MYNNHHQILILRGGGEGGSGWLRREVRFEIHKNWHPSNRIDRFPSVNERVRLYMSNWYAMPCRRQRRRRRPKNVTITTTPTTTTRMFPHYDYELSTTTTTTTTTKTTAVDTTWPKLNVSLYDDDDDAYDFVTFDSIVKPDEPILLDRRVVKSCIRTRRGARWVLFKGKAFHRVQNRRNMQNYCRDALELLDMMRSAERQADEDDEDEEEEQRQRRQTTTTNTNTTTPLIAFFGDSGAVHWKTPLPLFAKFRAAATSESIRDITKHECIDEWDDDDDGKNDDDDDDNDEKNDDKDNDDDDHHQYHHDRHPPTRRRRRPPLHTDAYRDEYKPIIWKFGSSRHFRPLPGANRMDSTWENKIDRAFWAGVMTGHYDASSSAGTDLERCLSNQRCRFVLDHVDSKLIDGGLTKFRHSDGTLSTRPPRIEIDGNGGNSSSSVSSSSSSSSSLGSRLMVHNVDRRRIQRHKIIISLEGNDVASGLKWSLQSSSVVLMPPPTRTSWAMEEYLRPWVHYVPMNPDGRDAEEMVRWVIEHDEEARRIAERATLFIYDLVHHPDAVRDDRAVKEEMIRRYRSFWHGQ